MNKPVNIIDRKLFNGNIKRVILSGFELEVGKLKDTGKMAVAAVILDEHDRNYQGKLKHVLENHHRFAVALEMPEDARELWLESYEDAIVEQSMSQDDAEKYAWQKVRESYHQTDSGHWVKLSEEWLEEVKMQLEPTVQVLATGKYIDSRGHEVDITIEKLDQMVNNFNSGKFVFNATVDHVQAGPAMGTGKKLFRVGDKLFATLTQLVPAFVKKVKAGMYKYISSEFWDDYIDGAGKSIGALFTTVSFLGSKKPAIKGMATPAMSENGVSFLITRMDAETLCIQLTEHKPLNDRKEGHLAFRTFETEKDLDDYVKAKIDIAVTAKLSEEGQKHKDELRVLKEKNDQLEKDKTKLSEAEKNRKQTDALKLAEAEVATFTSKEKMKIPPQNEAAKKNWINRFQAAFLAENSEAALKDLRDELEGMPNLVKFGEFTKDKENDHPQNGSVKFSEANEDKMAKVAAYMKEHGWEYTLSETGMINPKDNLQLGRAIAAVTEAEE